jgi:hypothetical protein
MQLNRRNSPRLINAPQSGEVPDHGTCPYTVGVIQLHGSARPLFEMPETAYVGISNESEADGSTGFIQMPRVPAANAAR